MIGNDLILYSPNGWNMSKLMISYFYRPSDQINHEFLVLFLDNFLKKSPIMKSWGQEIE